MPGPNTPPWQLTELTAKPLYRSATFYTAVSAIVLAIGAYMAGEATFMQSATIAFGALGGIFIRKGMKK